MHSPAVLQVASGTVDESALPPIRGLTVTSTVVPLGTPDVAMSMPVTAGRGQDDVDRAVAALRDGGKALTADRGDADRR